ncbi:leucyl aminopeptidase [Helicobacter mesocricetorum]|uniref:leucyl aminopeptidase n=1 Tax=Helicobacter mesocricetorum TaxID=87012 RepID=UPI000CF02416|nr:leucyl aminopeptidase [Helicobacter mesocricetorum]
MKILANYQKGEVEILFIRDKKMSQLTKAQKDTLSLLGFEGIGNIFIPESKTFFIGIQKSLEDFPNSLRDSLAQAIINLKKLKIKSISLEAKNLQEVKEICEGILLGDYTFDTFKSEKSKSTLKEVYIHTPTLDKKAVDSLIAQTQIITYSVNTTRELINTPPMKATPQYIVDFVKKLSKEVGFECKVYDAKFLEKEKMEAFLAVSKASCHSPYLVHLTYKPKTSKKSNLKKFVFVGKGLTYDCGGLSLKPGDYMTTMKADKSGACAVIGIIDSLARLGVEAEIHGILGLTENMIGGNAYKPDDILIARNGKSIEVRNTDAEGRLVLADCLSYASDLKPDFLIDLATLTGACVVALGDYTMGIMGYNQKLKEDFLKIASNAGELGGILPFNPYLKKLYKSEVADLCNIPSSRYGSAITAGMFLGEFVAESLSQKWLHLDIAGPAYVEKSWGVNPFGATGAGVRACIEFVRQKSKA